MIRTNIPIHRKNNKECKVALGQWRERENKRGEKKRSKMKEKTLEFTIN